MRLPLSNVYRAFPELDSYDDATCREFILQAKGSGMKQTTTTLLLWASAVAAFFLVSLPMIFGLGSVLSAIPYHRREDFEPAVAVLMILCLFLPVALVPLLIRDCIIRRRVQAILKQGSACARCSYALLGLPVTDRNTVVCPECGHVTSVDRSIRVLERKDKAEKPV